MVMSLLRTISSKIALCISLGVVMSAAGCGEDSACYSPTVGLETAPHPLEPDSGPPGCACDPAKDQPVCATLPSGGRIAMFCIDGHWKVGWDGPCFDPPPEGN
jgi:hypothetical protein